VPAGPAATPESSAEPAPAKDLLELAAADAPPPSPTSAPFGVSAASAVALDETEMRDGKSPLGDWVADLGHFPSPAAADARWQALRRSDPQLVAGVLHLAGSGDGPQPLLVGPFASEGAARSFCGRLGAGASCEPLRL
jgi:hypothetical protein